MPGICASPTALLGGGTPSLFSAAAIGALLDRVRPRLAEDAEITLEANPGAVEHGAFGAYRQVGVNRLSIGAQSFSAAMLARLGRIHGPDETERAVAEARSGGFDNLNLDLMYGLPEQSPEDALADLQRGGRPRTRPPELVSTDHRAEDRLRPPSAPHAG